MVQSTLKGILLLVAMVMSVMVYGKIPQDSLHYKDGTRVYADTAIWQGMSLKVDLGTPIMEYIVSHQRIKTVEIAMNCRLKNRWYPTLEMGFAQAAAKANGGSYDGNGGFIRAGLDINGLRKNATSRHALLAGIRVGTAFQDYNLYNVEMNDSYWGKVSQHDFPHQFRCDVWGEVVAGVQVQVWEGIQMGWAVRLKILFTRKSDVDNVMSYYIPGFGYRDNTNWGFNYYIGYKF